MKKLSALLLAAVLLLSAIPAAGAASFKDTGRVAQVNTEAVDILSDLGIVTGYPDGSFHPDDTLTRAQAAKLLCCVLLGTKEADALPGGGASFSDVPASHWANKYVEYCVLRGVVSGDGSGRFDPDGKLTACAFGKMLLAALGADTASLTGADWEKNTAAQLHKTHLDYGADSESRALTRQSACRLLLNALFYNEGTDPESTPAYKVFGVYRVTDGTNHKRYYRPYRKYVSLEQDKYWKFDEKKVEASPDWLHKTGAVSGGEVLEALGVTEGVTRSHILCYRNGTSSHLDNKNNTLQPGNRKDYYLSGDGVQLEFYYTPETDFWTVIHLFYFTAKIKKVSEPKYNADGTVEQKGTVTFDNGWVCRSNDFTKADVGNYALVRGTGKKMKTMHKIDTAREAFRGKIVTGKLTAYDAKKGLSVDGTAYAFPAFLGTESLAPKYLENGGAIGDEVKVLLSDDGFALMVWK